MANVHLRLKKEYELRIFAYKRFLRHSLTCIANVLLELPPHSPFFPSAMDSAIESVTAAKTLSATALVTPDFCTTWSRSSVFFKDCDWYEWVGC